MLLALVATHEALADARWPPPPPPAAEPATPAPQPGVSSRSPASPAAPAVPSPAPPSARHATAAASASGIDSASEEGPLQRTGVVIGNGMSCTAEVAEAAALVAAGKPRRVSPYFVPRILPNMAAGAVSIRCGCVEQERARARLTPSGFRGLERVSGRWSVVSRATCE
jgi:hypothetical protein